MRGMCAAMLCFEAIILGLLTPVMIALDYAATGPALAIGVGGMVLAFVLAGMLRHDWAYPVGHALQVVLIGLGLVVPIMFFIGALFAVLWATAYLLGRRIEDDKAARSAGPA